uniref:Secreted protein n=1 Tax=Mesocestoides corti TaxID=53468 RepID=A0A5K3G2U7_MESCO
MEGILLARFPHLLIGSFAYLQPRRIDCRFCCLLTRTFKTVKKQIIQVVMRRTSVCKSSEHFVVFLTTGDSSHLGHCSCCCFCCR